MSEELNTFTGRADIVMQTATGPGKIMWPDGSEVTAEQVREAGEGYRRGHDAAMAGLTRLRRLIEAHKASWDDNGNPPEMEAYEDMLALLDGREVPTRWWDA